MRIMIYLTNRVVVGIKEVHLCEALRTVLGTKSSLRDVITVVVFRY